MGGPIIKDKLFFFVFYEGQRFASLSTSSRVVPSTADVAGAMADIAAKGLTISSAGQALLNFFPITPSGILVAQTPTTAKLDEGAFKIDYQLNKKNTISGRCGQIIGRQFSKRAFVCRSPCGWKQSRRFVRLRRANPCTWPA